MKHQSKLIINNQKNTCPESNKRKYRSSPSYNEDGMPVAQSKKYILEELNVTCVCGVKGKISGNAKNNKYFGPKWVCDVCKKYENMFGKGKNFLTTLEGL